MSPGLIISYLDEMEDDKQGKEGVEVHVKREAPLDILEKKGFVKSM